MSRLGDHAASALYPWATERSILTRIHCFLRTSDLTSCTGNNWRYDYVQISFFTLFILEGTLMNPFFKT
jgi:hypothetical protein